MRVTKTITFDTGHRLSDYEGKCKRLHGHTYKLEVTVERAELTATGFVMDFGDLKTELQKIHDTFDHKLILNSRDRLNSDIAAIVPEDWVVWFAMNPTAEHIAKVIGDSLNQEIGSDKLIVRLWETDTSYAEYAIDNKQ